MQASTATRFFPLLVTIAAALGCGGSPPPRATSVATSSVTTRTKAETPVPVVQGTWTMTQRGDGLVAHELVPMKVEINGRHVLGTFGACNGKIDGELEGNVVKGTWEERDGNGDFQWVLAPDGKTFTGTFGGMLHSQKVPEGATWNGVHR